MLSDSTVNFSVWENIPGSNNRIYICDYDDYEVLINDVRRMIKETGKSYSIDEYCVENKYRKPFSTFVEEYDESAEEDVEEEIPAKTFTEEQRREIIETLAKRVAWSFGFLLRAEGHQALYEAVLVGLRQENHIERWGTKFGNREELEDCIDEIMDDMSKTVNAFLQQDQCYDNDAVDAIGELLHDYGLDS